MKIADFGLARDINNIDYYKKTTNVSPGSDGGGGVARNVPEETMGAQSERPGRGSFLGPMPRLGLAPHTRGHSDMLKGSCGEAPCTEQSAAAGASWALGPDLSSRPAGLGASGSASLRELVRETTALRVHANDISTFPNLHPLVACSSRCV